MKNKLSVSTTAHETDNVITDDRVVYIDGVPFTQSMIDVFRAYKPVSPPKPATIDDLVSLLDN